MGQPGFFLFIFVLLKHKFYKQNVGFSKNRTRIFGVEDEHADNLTTTTALYTLSCEQTNFNFQCFGIFNSFAYALGAYILWNDYQATPPELQW